VNGGESIPPAPPDADATAAPDASAAESSATQPAAPDSPASHAAPSTKLKALLASPLPAMAAGTLLAALHLVFLTRSPLLRHLTLDLQSYDAWARRILEGEVLGRGVFYQDPLYPYLLALVYKLAGADVLNMLVLQVVANAAVIFIVHRLGSELFGSATGRLAGWMAALYAPALYYAGKPEKAPLAAFLLALAFFAIHRAAKGGVLRWIGIGALLGLGALLRGNVLLLAIALGILLLATRTVVVEPRARFRAAAALAGGVALVLGPVLLRNQIVGEDWVFTTSQAGANLFIGNNSGNTSGTYGVPSFVRPSPLYEEEDFRRHAESVLGHRLRPSEVSRFYVGEVIRFMREEPGQFLRLQLTKIVAFLDRWEYPDNWSIAFVAGFSPVLRLPLLTYGAIVPFAFLGALFSLFGRDAARRRWLPILVIVYAASVVLFFVFSRYRFPIVFALLLLAAHAVVTLAALVRERRVRALAGSALVVALVFWVSRYGKKNDEAGDLSQRFYNLSASLLNAGKLDEAAVIAQRSVDVTPANGLAFLTLSRVAELKGDLEAARAT
jgi:4-amino-4-deoxy-L-arabinose transferase-like glycosyltransferase